ncbi:unnamed protein product, partial [Oikopleura dioica]
EYINNCLKNEKINDFLEQLHKWLEGFEQRLELPPVEVEKPKKKQKGFRRKMKMTDSMSFFLKAAQSSFTDVSKCRYLRGKNATDIDMSQVTKTRFFKVGEVFQTKAHKKPMDIYISLESAKYSKKNQREKL